MSEAKRSLRAHIKTIIGSYSPQQLQAYSHDLQQRLLTTPNPEFAPVTRADRRPELVLALAPMALAFLYLTVLTVLLFR